MPNLVQSTILFSPVKRRIGIALACFLWCFSVFAQPTVCPVNAGPDVSLTCSSNCTNLTATYFPTRAATSYTVASIAYTPQSFTAGVAVNTPIDDSWYGVVTIPFPFCFFGNTYTQIVPGSNGCLTFNTASANQGCPWSYSASVPSAALPSNSIFTPYHDIDPSVGSSSEIRYIVSGTAPCRRFTVSYYRVPFYSCNGLQATHQVVLYETTNIIEVYIQSKPACGSWNGGRAVVGIQGIGGTAGIAAPGRNTGNWTANNEGWRFSPAGANTSTFNWLANGSSIGTSPTINVCPSSTTTYTAEVRYTNCNGTLNIVNDQVVATVTGGGGGGSVSINPSSPAICAGASVALSASGASTYVWSPSTGLSATTGANVTASPATTTTYTVTGTLANGCTATNTVTVTVNPLPVLNVSVPAGICLGSSANLSVSGASSYSWSPATGLSATSGANVTANPSNTSTYTITGTSAGCNNSITATLNVWPLPSVTMGFTAASCFGGCNGTATATPAGGTSPYTYAWSPTGGNAAIANGLCVGNYSCVVTDARSCTGSGSVAITAPTQLTASQNQTNALCNGASNGTALVSGVAGGIGPYTYSWSPSGGNAATATGLAAGNYTCTITDANLCTISKSFTITQPTAVTASLSFAPVSCFGGSNGTATVASGGGTPPYAYSWTPNVSSSTTATALVAGNYSVIVTDANGCNATANTTVTQPAGFSVAITATTDVSCFGGNNGTATAAGTGGSGVYSYSWSGGGGNVATGAGFFAGNYTVTAADGNGCTATATATINQPTVLTATISATTDVSCFGGNDGTATVQAAGGTSPYTYSWTNGNLVPTSTLLSLGTNTATVTDALGCTASAMATINQPTLLTIAITSTQDVSCFSGNNGSAVSIASGGTSPYAYSWTNGDASANASNLIAGNFTVTATDGEGCTTNATVTITQPTLLAASVTNTIDVSCFGYADGEATVAANGGTVPYAYSWTNGDAIATATNLSAGNHTATITDANGCNAAATAIISQPSTFTVAITATTDVSCFGGNNGTATAAGTGGSGIYSYSWSGGGGNVATGTGFFAGNYTVTAVDGNGCTATATATINQPTVLTATISATTDVSCFGGNDGTATVQAAGGTSPYTYSWTNGNLAPTSTLLSLGTNTATVTDALGCTASAMATINQPTLLTIAITSTQDVSCFSGNNGSAVSIASGGTSPYAYSWTNGDASANASNLIAGNFTVTATDGEGCTTNATATITQPTLLAASVTNTIDVSCFGYADGEATVAANGGTVPYAYSWTNGDAIANATNLSAGNHTATITDALGCIATVVATINQPTLFAVSIIATTHVSCFGGNDGTSTALAVGGTANYTYAWSPIGGNSANGTGFIAGQFTVTATDAQGCISTAIADINEPILLTQSITATTDVSCFGGNDGTATIGVNGGTPPFTNIWTNGQTNQPTATGLIAGNIASTVTDSKGCTTTTSATINEPTLLSAIISATNAVSCFGRTNGNTTALAAGGTSPYSYSWTNGGGNLAAASNLSAGSYTVTITDTKACNATATAIITEPTLLSTAITATTDASCFAYSDGSATTTATGGVSPYTFLWTNGDALATATALLAGNHSVTATDANGCTATATAIINEPSQFTVSITATTDVSCFGGNDGTALSLAMGGTQPYGYLWSNGDQVPNASLLIAGNYQVSVTDANGCVSNASTTINEPSLLAASILSQTDISCFGGNDGTAEATAFGGTLPYLYLWSTSDNAAAIINLSQGVYTVNITDNKGCIANAQVTIAEPPLLSATVDATTNATCLGFSNGTAQISAQGGTVPYTFAWPDGTNSPNVTTLLAGNYTVGVQDDKGCSTSVSLTITEPTLLEILTATITDASCNGVANGAIDISISGGTLPYSFVWSPSGLSEDLVNQAAGDYMVVVTDGNQCTTTANYTIGQPTALVVDTSSVNISCFGFTDGEASLNISGATPPYTYTWNNGSSLQNLTGLGAGSYSVSLFDANNCPASANFVLKQPDALVGVITTENVTCYGYSDGSASFSVTGGIEPYNFVWSNGVSSSNANGLIEGQYWVITLDANACQISGTATITQPQVLAVEITTEEDILAMESFEISTSVTGGTPYFTYQWQPATLGDCMTCESLNGKIKESTEIIVQAIDANQCVAYDTVRIRIIENEIYVPNAFSPNEDNQNETFKVYTPPGITDFELRIFNRWGEQLFMTNDLNNGWNGKYEGKIKVDVYTYKVSGKFPNGKVISLMGTVVLL